MLRANLGKFCAVGALLSLSVTGAFAQAASPGATIDFGTRYHSSPAGSVLIPPSSVPKPAGRARTHLLLTVPPAGYVPPKPGANVVKPAISGSPAFAAITPGALACIYGVVAPTNNCNPEFATSVSTRGSKAVAIVDAYHYPTAMSDANYIASAYGLPQLSTSNFVQTWVGGQPPNDTTATQWSIEGALDIQMVHAMAPNAKIYYVEAQSDSYGDLFAAVGLATSLVAQAGGGQVTMSWGGGETSGYESYFTPPATPNYVTYFASTGDTGDTSYGNPSAGYPAFSPQVMAVGGTSAVFDQNLNYVGPKTWQSGGTGVSQLFTRPSYQNSVASVVGSTRGVPDVSAIANPATPVLIYNSWLYGPELFYVGGTSVASPVVAGLVNALNIFEPTTNALLQTAYANANNPGYFVDVTYGFCGPYEYYNATAGYDICTGLGTPK